MMPRPLERIAAVALLALAAGGCMQLVPSSEIDTVKTSSPWNGEEGKPSDALAEDRRELAAYVEFMDVVDGTDAEGWRRIFEQTFLEYKDEPSTDHRIRLALVMSQRERSPQELDVARDLLQDVIDDPGLDAPLTRRFAELRLAEVERLLGLHSELRSLRKELSQAKDDYARARRDRAALEERVRRVDAALAEANAKLRAVTNIERSMAPMEKKEMVP